MSVCGVRFSRGGFVVCCVFLVPRVVGMVYLLRMIMCVVVMLFVMAVVHDVCGFRFVDGCVMVSDAAGDNAGQEENNE